MGKEALPWKTDELMILQAAQEVLVDEALAFNFNPGRDFQLLTATLVVDATVVAVEDFSMTHNSRHGASFDHVIDTQAMNTKTEHVFDMTAAMQYYETGDSIDFAFANTNANAWTLLIVYREKS